MGLLWFFGFRKKSEDVEVSTASLTSFGSKKFYVIQRWAGHARMPKILKLGPIEASPAQEINRPSLKESTP